MSARNPAISRRTALKTGLAAGVGAALLTRAEPAAAATHPGLLHTQADFDRMRAQVNAGAQPWKAGWDRLVANAHSQSTWTPRPTATIIRGGDGQNYPQLYNDIHAAYQNALRWKISGSTAHGNKARDILNAWSGTLTTVTGNADRFLAAGIYGYQFANVGEIMRGYSGFDLARFQRMMLNVFHPLNEQFLTNHNDACITNYWANWDLCNMNSILAIGVLCDRQDLIDRAVTYFRTGAGNGSIMHAIPFLHSGGLAQWQESGRDQGHTVMGVGQMGAFCEMAWNQGIDLYGYADNRFMKACEYIAKYNLGQDVPFTPYTWGTGQNCAQQTHTVISSAGRGHVRPVWETVYHHYAVRRGLPMPYAAAFVAQLRPEGGGGDYGTTSGGFDQLGFGTLTHARVAATATLPAGTTRSLRSANYPARFIRHQNYLGYLHEVSASSDAQTRQDATFTIVPGLAAPNGYSLRAANGQYLRHYDFRVRLAADDGTATFKSDATFYAVPGVASGSVRLESSNFPGRYLRHRNYELWVDPYDGTSGFRDDSSFTAVTAWA
ncbi:alginate lyase [Nonomuraea polychroma]|uniref:Alginate lyase n=1 Tax=Nonomuraea polychroma TaxID=46176 RepID=A0A438LZ68_9ACTN|nr:AbfB domain-containing protein [Nonomuraea polychroma]RVX38701.1 alginate lyase [Nonomuraea polychroma]